MFPDIEHTVRQPFGAPLAEARIRAMPEDFRVVELPLVEPCGEGEHSWLRVRKRDSNTEWVARQLARHAGVAPAAVSYAGLKDRHAVTEQWFSVHLPGREDPDWAGAQCEAFQVLDAHRHSRKLKIGTLRGNRFELRLREVEPKNAAALEARLTQIADHGVANYFGSQRFGHGAGNLAQAARMFAAPKKRLPRAKRSLYLSATRSALFNRVLSARVEAGLWNRLLPGDALQLDGRSACFVAAQSDAETAQRLQLGDVHPTGPLCGDGERLCVGEALAFEDQVLAPYAAWREALARARVMAARRALRVIPREMHWVQAEDTTWLLSFTLPAGSYATVVLEAAFALRQSDEQPGRATG